MADDSFLQIQIRVKQIVQHVTCEQLLNVQPADFNISQSKQAENMTFLQNTNKNPLLSQ